MKKHPSLSIAAAGLLLAAFPLIAAAQTQVPPPPAGGAQVPGAGTQVQRLVKDRLENIENNRDIRNALVQKAKATTTTRALMIKRALVQRPIMAKDPAWLNASTSPLKVRPTAAGIADLKARIASSTEFKGREKWKEAKLDVFAKLHANLLSQAEHALKNLKDARAKLVARIDAASQSGRNMTEARAKLAEADAKIALAEIAVRSIASYMPPVLMTGKVSTSTPVKLDKPREIGKSAIEAIKEAKKALNEVVRTIAHNMGLKIGLDGRVTASTTPATSPTPAPTATPTPAAI